MYPALRHLKVVGGGRIVRSRDVQSPATAADILLMTGSRCPACGAATPETVPWCSLCYADLRPVPAAAVPAPRHVATEDVPTAAPGRLEDLSADPLTAPISTLLEPPTMATEATEALEPVGELLPGVVEPVLDAASWPCSRCGAQVPLALDACGECGAGFLAGAIPPPTMSVPIVGDVSRLSKGQRFGLAAGLAAGLILVFLALATVVGAVL
jgi:hypothetical protein